MKLSSCPCSVIFLHLKAPNTRIKFPSATGWVFLYSLKVLPELGIQMVPREPHILLKRGSKQTYEGESYCLSSNLVLGLGTLIVRKGHRKGTSPPTGYSRHQWTHQAWDILHFTENTEDREPAKFHKNTTEGRREALSKATDAVASTGQRHNEGSGLNWQDPRTR